MAAEGYLRMYGRLHDLRTLSLRLGNVYGPRQDPHGEAGVVAIFCGKLLDGEPPRVFGDGLQTRDYVYVGDVAEAFLAGEERMPAGETINIGCADEVTVIDLIEGLGSGEPVHEPARHGELQRSALANDKAAELLDWQPAMDIGDGLKATLESVRAHRQDPASRAPGALEVASAETG
jgi:UDP-glucose 4-epimerase